VLPLYNVGLIKWQPTNCKYLLSLGNPEIEDIAQTNQPTSEGQRGKRASVNCQLCGNMEKQTLFHVLNHCKHSLDQGRLTWRDDSVLNHIVGCLKSALVGKSTVELYCDLDGLQAPVADRSRLTSWCRHRDWSLSSITGRCIVGIE
jgi:hypothetical protein